MLNVTSNCYRNFRDKNLANNLVEKNISSSFSLWMKIKYCQQLNSVSFKKSKPKMLSRDSLFSFHINSNKKIKFKTKHTGAKRENIENIDRDPIPAMINVHPIDDVLHLLMKETI